MLAWATALESITAIPTTERRIDLERYPQLVNAFFLTIPSAFTSILITLDLVANFYWVQVLVMLVNLLRIYARYRWLSMHVRQLVSAQSWTRSRCDELRQRNHFRYSDVNCVARPARCQSRGHDILVDDRQCYPDHVYNYSHNRTLTPFSAFRHSRFYQGYGLLTLLGS